MKWYEYLAQRINDNLADNPLEATTGSTYSDGFKAGYDAALNDTLKVFLPAARQHTGELQ